MKFRVTILPRAQQDRDETYRFIAEHQQQPSVAARWVNGIEEAIQSPASLATRGPIIREQEFLDSGQEVRQILFRWGRETGPMHPLRPR